MKGIHTEHFAEIGRYGIDPLCMFWGDVNPLVEEFKDINIKALLVEESKKTFRLDIREIYERIGGEVCLFGNVDSITLLKYSSPSDVEEEAAGQVQGIDTGFICANGSPIVPGTPESNVQALIDAVKER
jgi:uroporphyrinogen-III decarboxylase